MGSNFHDIKDGLILVAVIFIVVLLFSGCNILKTQDADDRQLACEISCTTCEDLTHNCKVIRNIERDSTEAGANP